MTYQTGQNIVAAYKAQSALGTPASGGSGLGLRWARGSTGLRLLKGIADSEEVRRDGQSTRGRHSGRKVTGGFNVEASVGTIDTILAALLRASWTAATDITQATMTSITTTTSTIVAAAGSWLTQGVRVGDVVKLTGHSTSGNNGVWFRVTAVTASTITVAGTPLTLDAGADSSFTLTVARTVVMGSAPTETYFTVDEYNQDIDKSKVATDCKWNRLEIIAAPKKPVLCKLGLIGLDMGNVSGASAPSLTSPTFTTTLPLMLEDGTIRVGGVDYSDLTGFNLTLDLGGEIPDVLAPNAPDAFLGNAKLRGNVMGLRTDFDFFDAFDNETQIDFFAHMTENESNPKDFLSLYVGNAVFDGNDDPPGGEGPLVESIPWRAGIDDVSGSSHASTMMKLSTSAT